HHTSAPKSAMVVIQLWYNCLRADWLRPRSVFPKRDRAIKTLMVEVVLVRMWCFHVSFLSSQKPNHLCTVDGLISIPLRRTTLMYGSMIYFLALLKCMSSDFGSSKATALSLPHLKHVVTPSSRSAQL